MKTSHCTCRHAWHSGTCRRYGCGCRESKPLIRKVVFLPVKHGDLIDEGGGAHDFLGFKPGRASKREGWLVYAVAEHAIKSKPRKLKV